MWDWELGKLSDEVLLLYTLGADAEKNEKYTSITVGTESSPKMCSKRFFIYSKAGLFGRTPPWLLWEYFSHAAINT